MFEPWSGCEVLSSALPADLSDVLILWRSLALTRPRRGAASWVRATFTKTVFGLTTTLTSDRVTRGLFATSHPESRLMVGWRFTARGGHQRDSSARPSLPATITTLFQIPATAATRGEL